MTMPGPVDTFVWFWGRRGGGPVFALKFARWLAEARPDEKLLLSFSETSEELEAARASGLPLVVEPDPRVAGSYPAKAQAVLAMTARFRRDMKRLKPRRVVIPMNFAFAWPLVHLVPRGTRVTYVVHDDTPHPGDYARLWQESTQKRLVAGADRVLALSEAVGADVLANHRSVKDKLRIVPINAFYADALRPSSPPRATPADHPLQLLFVGRLIAYKGLSLLRAALEPLKARDDWRLTIAGSGPDKSYADEAFKSLPQVTLRTEWLSQPDLQGLIAAADVLVCPYVEASQSAIIPEGLALGTPSIVTPVGALPEQVGFGEAGEVAAHATAEALSAAIGRLIDDREHVAALQAKAPDFMWASRAKADLGGALG
ncbi:MULTISPECIES: glycosyltransferase family 4 protein [unclassified Chelatococcus]|uniref:glycosyltransferase family 4 protein n=1 Tax=unclassified Chelatococcus TaxID=2638111 RepID=UPI001BD1A2A4|nr:MULTISPECIES: glycosyltransferase family 4 protein [unclassified Chelatococcus]MBS7695678.1 glycosyltransferase family 4 protein [Chelatococcus sp. YT9]MBX3557929.1 glycosyltransferase family 4 protein [Chelatococcus sp.]